MSRDHSQNHYGPNASFDGYDSDLASAGILIESLRQQLAEREKQVTLLRDALESMSALGVMAVYNGSPHWIFPIKVMHRSDEALAATEPK